jgi:hypothetical protein
VILGEEACSESEVALVEATRNGRADWIRILTQKSFLRKNEAKEKLIKNAENECDEGELAITLKEVGAMR